MPKAHDPCHDRFLPLIELALREGWNVCRTSEGVRFVKPGLPPIFTGAPGSSCFTRISLETLTEDRHA